MNSREESLHKPLDTVSEKQLADRIAELEHQVAALKKEVAMLKDLSGWPLFAEDAHAGRARPGPKEKIDDADLFHSRDALILWLEPVWPWLEDRLGGTTEDLRAALEAVAEEPEIRQDWQRRLIENTSSLHKFLRDERSGKSLGKATVIDALALPWGQKSKRAANQLPTRRIANAMAGVPNIAWRTSLDRCSAQPSEAFIALNLDMHLREKIWYSSSPRPRPHGIILSRAETPQAGFDPS